MDNPETLATFGSQDTGRRQRKQKAQHRKLTKGEQHVPTKNPVTKGEQHVPTKNPVTKGEQHVPIKNPGVCDKVCQVSCNRSAVFFGYSSFLPPIKAIPLILLR